MLGAAPLSAEELYEAPGALRARELLPPELREGPCHRVADVVSTDGLLRVYAVETEFGRFEARGEDVLRARIREAEALVALRDARRMPAFAAAEKQAGPSPFVSGRRLGGGTIRMRPQSSAGAGVLLPGLPGADAAGGDFLGQLVAFQARKREIAAALGVDPYCDNAPLQEALDRHAWAVQAGGAPLPSAAPDASATPVLSDGGAARSERAGEMLRDYSAEDLERLNRIELAVMGVPEPLREQFIANPAYSPSHETVLVEALAALEGTEDRVAFIEAAVAAQSGDEAQDYQRMAELMRRYADRAGGLERIERVEGGVAARAQDGTLVVPVRADHALWTQRMASLAESVAREMGGDRDAARARIVFSGSVSPMAREHLENLGMSVAEDAMDAPPSEPDGAESGASP